MNMLGIGKIDDLHKEYELQKREVYIKNTSNAICKLGYIAEKLESAYETKYRLDPSYKNEERMRCHGRFGGLTSNEEAFFAAVGLVLAVCSPAILMVILLGLFATPR